MTKQEILDEFSDINYVYNNSSKHETLSWMLDELLKEQKWNLLKEDTDGIIHGLPGDDGPYLMTDGQEIWIDIYVDGVSDGIILDSGRDVREIKAWMYLPKLPKGEKNDR